MNMVDSQALVFGAHTSSLSGPYKPYSQCSRPIKQRIEPENIVA
jgi:hypothetical protein